MESGRVKSVRKEATRGALCGKATIPEPWTASTDAHFKVETWNQLSGVGAGNRVLDSFVH